MQIEDIIMYDKEKPFYSIVIIILKNLYNLLRIYKKEINSVSMQIYIFLW